MQNNFNHYLKSLQHMLFIYGEEHSEKKLELLKAIQLITLQRSGKTLAYHCMLLFLAAHPENIDIYNLAQNELNRISRYIKKNIQQANEFSDTGLPYTSMLTRYSHDLLNWLNEHKECHLSIDSFEEKATDLNALLALTLPALERDETTIGLNNEDLLDALKVSKKDRLTFLLNEFSKLNDRPLIKDHLWESLKCWVNIHFKDKHFSKSFNRYSFQPLFFQKEIIKKFDHLALLNLKLGTSKKLNKKQSTALVDVIRKSLTLNMRETDPSTYMDENTLRLYELERGISIAIFGMKAERQMALQSYIGYTLFKNGYPAAYGGSWIFGKTALFGINISETFRGGESGYMMCQLLRVYKQAFGIDYFEVEPYQYGLDNPDGIKSGAFWFYYRYGFRPIDKTLNKFAEKEHLRIKTESGYKTGPKVLRRFTESNIALQLGEYIPVKLPELKIKVTKMIAKKFKGDRILAAEKCINLFLNLIIAKEPFNKSEKNVLEDVALLRKILEIEDHKRLEILYKMIRLKPTDPYKYNQLLTQLF